MGNYLSETCEVRWGVIQEIARRQGLYITLIDNLLRCMKLPSGAFADDFKYVAFEKSNLVSRRLETHFVQILSCLASRSFMSRRLGPICLVLSCLVP